jgi:hypothetical protein
MCTCVLLLPYPHYSMKCVKVRHVSSLNQQPFLLVDLYTDFSQLVSHDPLSHDLIKVMVSCKDPHSCLLLNTVYIYIAYADFGLLVFIYLLHLENLAFENSSCWAYERLSESQFVNTIICAVWPMKDFLKV